MQAERFRIFIASPSGLDDYRRAARDECGHIRADVAGRLGIDFDSIGWEDLRPGFGRPQGVINPALDQCNLLIGILGKQLGTPTGNAVSGFVEEYERMADRRRAGEDVELWIYTLEISEEALEDPGDRLRSALEFRRRLYREALVKEVRNVDEFRGHLYRDLNSLVLDAQDRRDQRSESVAAPELAERHEEPKQELSDEAGVQLRELLGAAAAKAPLLPEGFQEERFPLARLALWLSTWEGWAFSGDTLGVHPLNRLYAMRETAVLSVQEKRHVLRSICGHRPVAPGWALVDFSDEAAVAALVSLAVSDHKDDVRIGAFAMIERESLDDWLAQRDVEIDRQAIFNVFSQNVGHLSDSVRDATIAFAADFGGPEAQDFLHSLAEDKATERQAREALIRLLAKEDLARAYELAACFDSEPDEETLATLRTRAVDATISQLGSLTRSQNEALRLFGIDLLVEHGEDATAALASLLSDPSDDVALAAFHGLCEIGASVPEQSQMSTELAAREGLRLDRDLNLARSRTIDARVLQESINWIDLATSCEYQVLAEDHWEHFQDVVRRDLADRFRSFARASRLSYAKRLGPALMAAIEGENVTVMVQDGDIAKPADPATITEFKRFFAGSEFNEELFACAALAGIARNGDARDAALVRSWLEVDNAKVREAAALALVRVGTDDDAARLLELSRPYGTEIYARAALAMSSVPSETAVRLLTSVSTDAAVIGARYLFQRAKDLSANELQLMLHNVVDEVRRVGVACAMQRNDMEGLDRLLTTYIGARTYYYDVVVLLDRLLFAPPRIRETTRKELLAVAGDDAPRRPRQSRTLRRAIELFTRARAS